MEYFKLIAESKLFKYFASSRGYVLRVLKSNYEEERVKVWKRRGKAYIKINYREIPLKQVIAAAFIKEYKKGDIVECIDGNIYNCRVENLRIISPQEHGRRTGGTSRNIPVRVIYPDGQQRDFPSERAAARELYCSYQTIINRVNGKYSKTVIDKYTITKIIQEAE